MATQSADEAPASSSSSRNLPTGNDRSESQNSAGSSSLQPLPSASTSKTNRSLEDDICDRETKILLVGESCTMSLTMALACMRGSFFNIRSSYYEEESVPKNQDTVRPNFKTHKTHCRQEHKSEALSNEIEGWPGDEVPQVLSYKIDARALDESQIRIKPEEVVWFNFP